MQALKSAVAVFCTACICAEVVSQLMGSARLRTCIKAVAGLYIVVSVLQAAPGLSAQAKAFSLPQTPAVQFGTLEDTVLQQAERQLEQTLEAQVSEETGCRVRLAVELHQVQGEVAVAAVRVRLADACSAGRREQVGELLRQALGTENVVFLNEEDVA